MTEPLVIGWVAIHKLFCDVQGNAVMAQTTLQHKYGAEMVRLGVIFRIGIGPGKNIRVACWPSKVRNWWTLKMQQAWRKKNKHLLRDIARGTDS